MAMASFAVILALAAFPSDAVEVSPIGKVLQLLSDLHAKISAEGVEAKRVYEAFSGSCHKNSQNLGFDIKTGTSEVAELNAAIEDQSARQTALNSKIDGLAGDIATDEADLKAATQIREKEAADFAAQKAELDETIDTLRRAHAIIEREMAKGSASLLQLKPAQNLVQVLGVLVQASMFGSADAARLTSLIQSNSDDGDMGAPDAAVYQSQSGGILDVLADLLDKALAQLEAANKKEIEATHNFEMLKQSLEDAIANGNKDMAAAKKALAAATETRAVATGDLSVTSKDLAGDKAALEDLTRECMTAAEDFELATKSRNEELAAIAKAKEIIAESTGGADKISYGASLFQVSSSSELAHFEAVRFVRDLARKNNSPALTQLATRMASTMQSDGDQFGKVKGLISDMVARLEDEASADATEKAHCDKELSETKTKQADKNAEIEKLSTKIDLMSARSAKLKEQTRDLQKALAEIAAAQAEANQLREEQHTLYVDQKAEMEKGLAGVKAALKVLRDYYASDDKNHAAAEGAGGGIIGLLVVCESDFTKGLAEIVSTEESAAAAHDQNTKENEIEVANKEQDVKYKTKESTDLDKATAEATSDRSGVQAELDAILEYLTSLEKRCIAKAETYADRAARRAAEIAGLKQALDILENETALIQRTSHRTLRGHRA